MSRASEALNDMRAAVDERLDPPTPAQCTALALVAIAEMMAEQRQVPAELDDDWYRVIFTSTETDDGPVSTTPLSRLDALAFAEEMAGAEDVEVIPEAEWQRRRAAA